MKNCSLLLTGENYQFAIDGTRVKFTLSEVRRRRNILALTFVPSFWPPPPWFWGLTPASAPRVTLGEFKGPFGVLGTESSRAKWKTSAPLYYCLGFLMTLTCVVAKRGKGVTRESESDIQNWVDQEGGLGTLTKGHYSSGGCGVKTLYVWNSSH